MMDAVPTPVSYDTFKKHYPRKSKVDYREYLRAFEKETQRHLDILAFRLLYAKK